MPKLSVGSLMVLARQCLATLPPSVAAQVANGITSIAADGQKGKGTKGRGGNPTPGAETARAVDIALRETEAGRNWAAFNAENTGLLSAEQRLTQGTLRAASDAERVRLNQAAAAGELNIQR